MSEYLEKFEGINILIDDIRLFNNSFQNYPKKNYLVNWCKENNLSWEIEHDIFICKKKWKYFLQLILKIKSAWD